MPVTRNGTKRPREPSLQLHIVLGYRMCRIGGRLGSCRASGGGAALEIPPFLYLGTNRDDLVAGHCVVGSLTGVVAS